MITTSQKDGMYAPPAALGSEEAADLGHLAGQRYLVVGRSDLRPFGRGTDRPGR